MTESGWRRAVDRIRAQGLLWVWRRFRIELVTPSTGPGRALIALRLALRALLAWPGRWLAQRSDGAHPNARDTLFAFYDLEVAPVTYDLTWFVVAAELSRRRLGLSSIQLLIVPGKVQGLRSEDPGYERIVDRQARRTRLLNMLLPIFSLLPTASGMAILSTRAEAAFVRRRVDKVYPANYDPGLPTGHSPSEVLDQAKRGAEVRCLRAPSDAAKHIERWKHRQVGARRLVTITLRQYEYGSARNSDLEAWAAFARQLDPERYAVCVVPDTGHSSEPPFSGLASLPEAAWNVGLRLALYQTSYLNLGVNTGPMHLCAFSAQTRYIIFKMLVEEVSQSSARYMRYLGFVPGEQLPFAGPFQKWVWEPDTVAVITREFEAMVAGIESQGPDQRA